MNVSEYGVNFRPHLKPRGYLLAINAVATRKSSTVVILMLGAVVS
jgi:hypothetical protein